MRRRLIPLLMAVAITASACGTDTAAPTSTPPVEENSPTAVFPVVVRGTVIDEPPERIVSLSATHTEILYAIGAGPLVTATDLFSDYPAGAATGEKIDAFNLNVEAVAALDPDVVLLAFDPGDAVSGLAAVGIPTVLFAPPGPADLDGVYAEIRDIGTLTGFGEEADALVESMSGEIEGIVAGLPGTGPFTYYFELDPTLFSAGSGTLIDSIMTMLGLENVAGPADGPFPQLSAEYLISADPDFIVLADTVCCAQSADSISQRPGWSALSAVAAGNVIELDDAVASRWGPRIVDLVGIVAAEVYGTG